MHKQIKYLLLTNSFFIFAINLFAPLYAIFVRGLTDNLFHVGGVWGFYIFAVGVLVLIISRYENRLKYADYFLILGFVFRVVGWVGYIFAGNILHLYMIQIALALGESFGTPSYNFLYSRFLDKGQVGSEWGLGTSVSAFVMGGAAIVGSLIVSSYGFVPLFVFMIVLSFISMILALKYRKSLGAAKLL